MICLGVSPTYIRVLVAVCDVVKAGAVLDARAAPRLVQDVLRVLLRIVRPVPLAVLPLRPLVVEGRWHCSKTQNKLVTCAP